MFRNSTGSPTKAFKHARWATNVAEMPQSPEEGTVGYAFGRMCCAGDAFMITPASMDA